MGVQWPELAQLAAELAAGSGMLAGLPSRRGSGGSLSVRQVGATLRFQYERLDKPVFQRAVRRPVADIRVGLRLVRGRAGDALHDARWHIDLPLPLDYRGEDSLRVRLADGVATAVAFRKDYRVILGGSEVSVAETLRSSPLGGGAPNPFSDTIHRWPSAALDAALKIVEALAAWQRAGAVTVLRPLRPDRVGGSLGDLLTRAAGARADVAAALAASADIDPPGWVLSNTDTTMSLYLDKSGELLLDLSETAPRRAKGPVQLHGQQLDLRLGWEPGPPSGAFVLHAAIPDFLVGGEVHERLLASLREDAAVRRLLAERLASLLADIDARHTVGDSFNPMIGSSPRRKRIEDEAFANWLEGCEALFVRMSHGARGSETEAVDTDLVWLVGPVTKGMPAGPRDGARRLAVLYEVDFVVPAQRGSAVSAPRVEVLALRWDDGEWECNNVSTLVPVYLYRLLRTLHALQRGVEEGGIR